MDDAEGAIGDQNRALKIKPDYPEAYNVRGAARQFKGDLDGALTDCDRAIQLSLDGSSRKSLDRLIAEAKQQLRERGKQ